MPSRAELEDAFAHYQAAVRRAAAERDWRLFADLFRLDATYVEHAHGRFSGRSEIEAWAVRTMSTFPGNAMVEFPINWSVFDEERGWIVCEVGNVMRDPGDGSRHEAPNVTILHYGGSGLFAYEEDVYNPGRFLEMVAGWARVADAHDQLPEDARPWLARYGSRVPS